jgi:transcriptional regulator with XRE-family HTH domain
MSEDRDSFGPRLRRERELRGLTLSAIAQKTKIKASLFAALERNDVSHWPSGIFGRAFVREYAAAIGLPPEPLVAEFIKLFPESGTAIDAAVTEAGSERLRLTFAEHRGWRVPPAANRALAAGLDVGVVLLLTWLMTLSGHVTFVIAVGVVALSYFSIATASVGRSLGSYLLNADKLPHVRPTKEQPAAAALTPLDLVDLMTTSSPSEALHPQ